MIAKKSESPLVQLLLSKIVNEFSLSPPEFKECEITEEDIGFLKDEIEKGSEFDPLNKRKELFDKLVNREAYYSCKKCSYGQIFIIWDNIEQEKDFPLELWGRIFRIFCNGVNPPKNKIQNYFKTFFLANTNIREFPESDRPIKPENINGGYTYPCDRQSIVIYRAEDATRVLIHELMHASCLDNHELGVDIIEAETEAWAELIYIALLSQGKKFIFNSLLQRQSEYIRKQNKKIKEYMNSPMAFPWRYTIGKQEVWERWGILCLEDTKPLITIGKSLRLTYPPDNNLKGRFKVNNKSTML